MDDDRKAAEERKGCGKEDCPFVLTDAQADAEEGRRDERAERTTRMADCRRRCDMKKHGMWGTPVHRCWVGMIARCTSANSSQYRNYGGRGITVCDRWRTFENFYKDMGDMPLGKSLDRINNDGNYEPGNCRWATPKEQARNRRGSKFLTAFGETKPMGAWFEDERCVVPRQTLSQRLLRGMNPERAITEPSRELKPREPEWLTAHQIADRWLVDTSTVYRWRREGSIPSMRVGGIVRIHRSVVEAAEDKAKHQASVAAIKRVRRRFQGVPDRIGSLD